MRLTAEEQREIARRASWYLDVSLGRFTGDSAVYPGQGVPDLDYVITLIASGTKPGASFFVDVASPAGGGQAVQKPFDITDLQAIRTFYIGFYGNVARPDVYTPATGDAIPV